MPMLLVCSLVSLSKYPFFWTIIIIITTPITTPLLEISMFTYIAHIDRTIQRRDPAHTCSIHRLAFRQRRSNDWPRPYGRHDQTFLKVLSPMRSPNCTYTFHQVYPPQAPCDEEPVVSSSWARVLLKSPWSHSLPLPSVTSAHHLDGNTESIS